MTNNNIQIIEAQDAYIRFLGNNVAELTTIASIHGYVCPLDTYNEGLRLRNIISTLRDENDRNK